MVIRHALTASWAMAVVDMAARHRAVPISSFFKILSPFAAGFNEAPPPRPTPALLD
ncbi:hypothetical protein D3C86_2105300 [compost metagenome]